MKKYAIFEVGERYETRLFESDDFDACNSFIVGCLFFENNAQAFECRVGDKVVLRYSKKPCGWYPGKEEEEFDKWYDNIDD